MRSSALVVLCATVALASDHKGEHSGTSVPVYGSSYGAGVPSYNPNIGYQIPSAPIPAPVEAPGSKYQDAAPIVAPVAPPTPATSAGTVHTVTVGGVKPASEPNGTPAPVLLYQPEWINANVGDTVRFVFMQRNHSVTQSTFDTPCVKKADGVDSGLKPNPDGLPGITWDYQVTTTEPIWMYCKQRTGNHCGKGMVFAINPVQTGDKSFTAFKQLAITQNGGELNPAPVAGGAPAPAPSAGVIVSAEGGSPPAPSPVPAASAAPAAPANVVQGQGTDAAGNACKCSCLCGGGSFDSPTMGAGGYGGWGGMAPKPQCPS